MDGGLISFILYVVILFLIVICFTNVMATESHALALDVFCLAFSLSLEYMFYTLMCKSESYIAA